MNVMTHPIAVSWTQLQTELRDLAFVLDRQGNHTAADLAATVAARIEELLAAEIQKQAVSHNPSFEEISP
jgi:hypothetical protein